MQGSLIISTLSLLSAAVLGAASPPSRVDTQRPAAEGTTLPTFVGVASDTASEADAGASSVFVLPGSPRMETQSSAAPPPRSASPVALSRTEPERPFDPQDRPPLLRRVPKLPEDMQQDSAFYLQRRLGLWNRDDAVKLMGEPLRHRAALDADEEEDGDILAFADPSKHYREFELEFARGNGKLRSVFAYPWKMKWDECRKLWGDKVSRSIAADGRRFYSYENRRLDVLVDRSGNVISFGLY